MGATPKLTPSTRPIRGDDVAWKREKDKQIDELQTALANAIQQLNDANRK